MNKLLTILFLSLVTAKASAQLNTFEPGQTIRADEMNENFEYLDDRVTSIGGSSVGCSNELLSGTWAAQSFYDFERETVVIDFYDDGTAVAEITGPDPISGLQLTYSLDADCSIKVEFDKVEFEDATGEGFLAYNGFVMTLVFYRPTTADENPTLYVKVGS